MPARLNCPSCKAPGTVAPRGDGDVVACSACGQQFKAVAPKAAGPLLPPIVLPRPLDPVPLSPAPKPVHPPWNNAPAPPPLPPPSSRRRPVEVERDDEDDEIPVRTGPPTGLIIGAGLALVVFVLAAVGAGVFFAFREPTTSPDTTPAVPVVAAPPKVEPVKLPPKPAERKPRTQPEITKIGLASSAYVEGLVGGKVGSGSAFCVHKDGLFVTNYHVVENVRDNAVRIVLHPTRPEQKVLNAKVVKRDAANDLALLQTAETGFQALELGDSDALTELQPVYAFGFPFGRQLATEVYPAVTVSEVKISSLRRRNNALHRIQLNGALNPGNSGCPVLDETGGVIGVVVSGIPGSGLADAIPSNVVRTFLTDPEPPPPPAGFGPRPRR
jgi:S1-C subfamily serine protease